MRHQANILGKIFFGKKKYNRQANARPCATLKHEVISSLVK